MNLIALVDKKWGIANKGRELVDIPEDKKLFREETYGKVVIMGRKTFESMPPKAFIGRKPIILTSHDIDSVCDVLCFDKFDNLLECLFFY